MHERGTTVEGVGRSKARPRKTDKPAHPPQPGLGNNPHTSNGLASIPKCNAVLGRARNATRSPLVTTCHKPQADVKGNRPAAGTSMHRLKSRQQQIARRLNRGTENSPETNEQVTTSSDKNYNSHPTGGTMGIGRRTC